MTRNVQTCRALDDLNRAAQIMWESDCGVVPIVDEEGSPVGMITDRNVCMSAYIKGSTLRSLRVRDAMASHVISCSQNATIETAMELMSELRVRRLPIVDSQGKLVGLLSLNDLAREARRQRMAAGDSTLAGELADALGAICGSRGPIKAAAPARVEASRQLAVAGV
jgi:predicted transcriptional regulator